MKLKDKISIENEKPVIRNLFTGKTKSGREFPVSLFLSQYGPRFYIANSEGYEREAASQVGVILSNGKASTDKKHLKPGANFALWCNNQFVNEKLFGAKVQAWLAVPDFDIVTYDEACEALLTWEQARIQAEIDSLEDSDLVEVVMYITGYGNAYSVNHEKLSNKASKHFEQDAQLLDKNKAIELNPDDVWEPSSYRAEIQYGEFRRMASEIREAKEAKEKAEQKAAAAERKEVEEDELMIFAKDVIYSRAGGKMLHSIGAVFGDTEIEVYTTRYASIMKRKGIEHTHTYHARDELKALGFKWNAEKRSWKYTQLVGSISQDFADNVIAIIKKYDTKVWPGSIGMEQCWECGTYFFPKLGDYDSGMPYCGC